MGHKHFENLIKEDIRRLIAEAEIAGNIPHQGEKGNAREYGIGSLILKYLPDGWDICSGFIADSFGNTSRQTDLIVYNKNILPAKFYTTEKAYVPIEAVAYAGEVKSSSNRKELEDSISKMRTIRTLKDQRGKTEIVLFYFAYSTDLKDKSELDRMYELAKDSDTNPPFVSICILNHGYWVYDWKKTDSTNIETSWITFPGVEKENNILAFLLGILNTIATRQSKLRKIPSYSLYLTSEEKFGDKIRINQSPNLP